MYDAPGARPTRGAVTVCHGGPTRPTAVPPAVWCPPAPATAPPPHGAAHPGPAPPSADAPRHAATVAADNANLAGFVQIHGYTGAWQTVPSRSFRNAGAGSSAAHPAHCMPPGWRCSPGLDESVLSPAGRSAYRPPARWLPPRCSVSLPRAARVPAGADAALHGRCIRQQQSAAATTAGQSTTTASPTSVQASPRRTRGSTSAYDRSVNSRPII